jgi:glycosyltransferase involved in cell wall biosynthesis
MKTALHILGRIERSGMERMLVSSAGIWEEFGWQVEILSLSSESEYQVKLTELGYRVHNLPNPWSIEGLSKMGKLFRRINPSIIHNHVERRHALTSTIAFLFANQSGRVRTVHNNFSDAGFRYWIRRFQNKVEKLAGFKVVVPSKDVYLNEQQLWHRESLIIENWAPRFDSGARNHDLGNLVRILILGNCSTTKRHEIVFRMIEQFLKFTQNDYKILIHHVGDSTFADVGEQKFLNSTPETYSLMVHGSVDEPQQIFSQSDCLLVTSTREGQSVSMLEAIRMGIPCVGILVPGLNWAENIPSVFLATTEAELLETFVQFLNERRVGSIPNLSLDIDRRFEPRRGVEDYGNLYDRIT